MTNTVMRILQSQEDQSVNFVRPAMEGGFFESRYVRRSASYFALYLSSQSGCAHHCRMCHLTASRQLSEVNASCADYTEQAMSVFKWYDNHGARAEAVHFNFMARGEPLANTELLRSNRQVYSDLFGLADERGLIPRFLISTIMPQSVMATDLARAFAAMQPEIYYSIYSLDASFRRRWLPKAMPPQDALGMLAAYQQKTRRLVKLHWAFIEGENDREQDIVQIAGAVKESGIHADINIVRYNPFSERFGRESGEPTIAKNVQLLQSLLPAVRVKVIPRVGRDVKASCGMFIDAETHAVEHTSGER